MGILETNQCLSSQLEKRKQDFQKLTEKFLMSHATVYSLASCNNTVSPQGIVTIVIKDRPSFPKETKQAPDFLFPPSSK